MSTLSCKGGMPDVQALRNFEESAPKFLSQDCVIAAVGGLGSSARSLPPFEDNSKVRVKYV